MFNYIHTTSFVSRLNSILTHRLSFRLTSSFRRLDPKTGPQDFQFQHSFFRGKNCVHHYQGSILLSPPLLAKSINRNQKPDIFDNVKLFPSLYLSYIYQHFDNLPIPSTWQWEKLSKYDITTTTKRHFTMIKRHILVPVLIVKEIIIDKYKRNEL